MVQRRHQWQRIRATADQSTRISATVLEDQVFPTASVEPSFKQDIDPLTITGGWRLDVHHRRAIDFGYYAGLDLAKSHDCTAIMVLELHTHENGWVNATTLERMKDKPYTEVLNRLSEIVKFLGQRTVVVADATGLGAPYIDFLRASTLRLRNDAPNRPPCEIPARENQYRQDGYLPSVTITVPKVDLTETLDCMLEAGRLEISANLAEAETLKGELLSLRRNGSTYEPHSSLVHDDLLMAFSLAA